MFELKAHSSNGQVKWRSYLDYIEFVVFSLVAEQDLANDQLVEWARIFLAVRVQIPCHRFGGGVKGDSWNADTFWVKKCAVKIGIEAIAKQCTSLDLVTLMALDGGRRHSHTKCPKNPTLARKCTIYSIKDATKDLRPQYLP